MTNAIRSISHASYFVYSPRYFSITDSDDALVQFKDLLDKLSAKVNSSLDDAVCGPTTGLTWKQRSGAKKQTRGSCITLGVLLNYSNILQNVDDATLEISLSSLFRCIQLSCQLDDKIVAAAISSLLGLSSVLWRQISCKCDSIGRGLATLFHSLEQVSSLL